MEPAMPNLVAEVGCNHMGSMEIAHDFIKIASSFCKVRYIKFQKRTPKELLTPEQYNAPHPVPANSYGKTYGEHRERLEFTRDQHKQLKEWCEEEGLTYFSSVWDLTAARDIVSLGLELIKVPSAANTNLELIRYLSDEFGGQIHLSLGMTTREEEDMIVRELDGRGRLKDTVLYACTSGYPVPFDEVYLLEIPRLKRDYGSVVAGIGFSGHHLGIALDIAAYALGATWIERHFTLDRTWKGTDHAASLEPDGLRRLQRDLLNTCTAMREREQDISAVEVAQREKLKWKPRSTAAKL